MSKTTPKGSKVLGILLFVVAAYLWLGVFDRLGVFDSVHRFIQGRHYQIVPQARENELALQKEKDTKKRKLAFQKEREEGYEAAWAEARRSIEEGKRAAEERRREEEAYKEAAKLLRERQDKYEDIQIALALQLIQSEAEAKEKRDKLLKESQDRQMALALQLIQSGSGVIPSIPSLNTVRARIINDFDGFKQGNIYKLDNGQIWEQTDFYIHTRIATMPSVIIWRDGAVYKMIVDGIDRAVTIQQLK